MAENSYRPPPDHRRQIVTQMRDQFRAVAYEAEMNILALKSQRDDESDEETIAEQIVKLNVKMENNIAAARKMDAELKTIPRAKPPKPESANPAARR